ncbi:MAG: hypothetical protein ABFD89_09640 [Bryobacteraceae bacterium]
MGTSLSRIQPKSEMANTDVFASIGYFTSPHTGRRYTRELAYSVSEAYHDALVDRRVVAKSLDWLVSQRFSCIPKCDLAWLNQVIARANSAELSTLRSVIHSAHSLGREARESVFIEAASAA